MAGCIETQRESGLAPFLERSATLAAVGGRGSRRNAQHIGKGFDPSQHFGLRRLGQRVSGDRDHRGGGGEVWNLPAEFETWSRYLRAARKKVGELKNRPRRGREGRSIVRRAGDGPADPGGNDS